MRIFKAIARRFGKSEALRAAARRQIELAAPRRRHRPPPGLAWRPVHDQKLNQELYSRRIGMLDFEAIELWAPGWDAPRRVFSLSADNFIHSNVDIMWRPLHCPETGGDWRWCN